MIKESLCSAKCKHCKYHGRAGGLITCDYIIEAKTPRGCPAGKGCDKYEQSKQNRRKGIEL